MGFYLAHVSRVFKVTLRGHGIPDDPRIVPLYHNAVECSILIGRKGVDQVSTPAAMRASQVDINVRVSTRDSSPETLRTISVLFIWYRVKFAVRRRTEGVSSVSDLSFKLSEVRL